MTDQCKLVGDLEDSPLVFYERRKYNQLVVNFKVLMNTPFIFSLIMIQVELSRIVISEINSQQVIFLREKGGGREFPIIIGIFEATNIDRKVKGFQPPRPLTHDLIGSIVEALGGRIQDVIINRMEEQTFFAVIRLTRGEELIEIDARPSDAIAVAVSNDPPLPIFIKEEILTQALAQKY